MGMSYSHLLVPPDPDLVFGPSAITAFLEAVARDGYVGKHPDRFVLMSPEPHGYFGFAMTRKMPKTGTHRGRNPPSWVRPDSEHELQSALARGGNLQATIWSDFRPERPIIADLAQLESGKRIDLADPRFDAAYLVAITCHCLEVPVHMSDDGHYHDAAHGFGDPVGPGERPADAIANYPFKKGAIRVPGIGAARSWVSVTFSKWVFPPDAWFDERLSETAGLDLVTPDFLQLAERTLETSLRQTCSWG
jgi:hypothetical protein